MGYLPTRADYKTAKDDGTGSTDHKFCVTRNPQLQVAGWEGCRAVCSRDICNCGLPTDPTSAPIDPLVIVQTPTTNIQSVVCQIPPLNLEKFGDKEVTGPRKTPLARSKRFGWMIFIVTLYVGLREYSYLPIRRSKM